MTTKEFLNDWLEMFDIKPTEIDNCRFTAYQMEQFAEGYHHTKAGNLHISSVSHQRELLAAFVKDWYKDNPMVDESKQLKMVDKFLAAYSG